MTSNNYSNEIADNDDSQRFHRIRTGWFHNTQQPSVPKLYEQTVTTTTTTTTKKESNSVTDEMTTTRLERSPIRRVNLVSGPQSAFARLFPDKYRQEQEELANRQRSHSSDNQRYNFDRIQNQSIISDHDESESMRKARRVSFYDQQCESFLSEHNGLSTRAKSEPHLSTNLSQVPLNYDPDPEIVYRDNPNKVVYFQKVGVRYLKPPTPPPPGPLIVREVPSTPPQDPPPLVVCTTPPIAPHTPSPLIVREQPPTPPQHQPSKVITKKLPPPAPAPRRVVIKRVPPLPAKPRPVIIEKWLPYKTPPERSIIYERVQQSEQIYRVQRDLILQYEPARIRVEQQIQNAGCFRVDPNIYRAKFGSSLLRTDSIRRVLEDIGCNPDLITSTGYQTCYPLNRDNYSTSHHRCPKQTTTCFTDEQLSELIGSSTNTYHHYNAPTTFYDENQVYYTTCLSNSQERNFL